MKAAFLAVSLGAIVAVNAADSPSESTAAAAPPSVEELSKVFGSLSGVNWENFSPEKLGMNLRFDEMSQDELEQVVKSFVELGLIPPEESERFMHFMVDPSLREMLRQVSENWGEVMTKVISDPEYLKFLKDLQNKDLDEEKLARIVGLKNGLSGAVEAAQKAVAEAEAAEAEAAEEAATEAGDDE